MRGKQDCGENQANGDGPDQFCCCKFFTCEQSDFVEKLGDTQSFKSTGWIIREAWWNHESKFQSRRSVEFWRMAKGCSTVLYQRETNLWQRTRIRTLWIGRKNPSAQGNKPVATVTTEHQGCSGKFKIPEDSGDSKPKSRFWQRGESLLDRKTRCERGDLVCIHVSRWIRDPSKINLRSLWNNYSRQLRGWSKSRRRRQECLRSTETSVCGENRLFCVIELFELWIPKPTSFPTLCFAWEASVLHQFKLGKTKWNSIWKFAISKNWIELLENRWNSSGTFSQDSLHSEFSMRFKRWWQNWSVNLSNFQKRSSSCPCSTTLCGELQEMKKIV